MRRSWTLRELQARFPGLDSSARGVLRCARSSTGRGRHIKWMSGFQECAEVLVHAEPADAFSLDFRHKWPPDLPTGEAEMLDDALLEGLLEGTLRCEAPAWECRLTCAEVSHTSQQTTAMAVRIAAALAVESMVRNEDWVLVGSGEPEAS